MRLTSVVAEEVVNEEEVQAMLNKHMSSQKHSKEEICRGDEDVSFQRRKEKKDRGPI